MIETTERIVEVVLDELMHRRGIKEGFFQVMDENPATFVEIKATLLDKVEAVLAARSVSVAGRHGDTRE